MIQALGLWAARAPRQRSLRRAHNVQGLRIVRSQRAMRTSPHRARTMFRWARAGATMSC